VSNKAGKFCNLPAWESVPQQGQGSLTAQALNLEVGLGMYSCWGHNPHIDVFS